MKVQAHSVVVVVVVVNLREQYEKPILQFSLRRRSAEILSLKQVQKGYIPRS